MVGTRYLYSVQSVRRAGSHVGPPASWSRSRAIRRMTMPKTTIVDIRNHVFAPAAIEADGFVVWRNLDPVPHTVETDPDASFYFNVGPLATGEISSPVWFGKSGKFPYVCRYHAGMTGE